MRCVILESPFAGDVEANVKYAQACVRDSLMRGEAPIASHLLYTQPGILDDDVPTERRLGIDAGLAWRHVSDGTVVYTDRGISKGMQYGINAARAAGKTVEMRSLGATTSRPVQPYLDSLLAAARECTGDTHPDRWESRGQKHLDGKCGARCALKKARRAKGARIK